MEGSEAERADMQPSGRAPPDRPLELRRLGPLDATPGKQHEDRDPPSRRSANASALDDDGSSHWTSSTAIEDRLPFAEQLQHVAHGHRERAVVGDVIRRLLSKQRDLERAPPRRGERRQHVVEDVLEQVAQPGVREVAFGLRRTRCKHAVASVREPRRRPPARASTSRSPPRPRARVRQAPRPDRRGTPGSNRAQPHARRRRPSSPIRPAVSRRRARDADARPTCARCS